MYKSESNLENKDVVVQTDSKGSPYSDEASKSRYCKQDK